MKRNQNIGENKMKKGIQTAIIKDRAGTSYLISCHTADTEDNILARASNFYEKEMIQIIKRTLVCK